MGDIFNLDNKFFQGINKVVDCIGLSVLWLICCIPVVTAGTATTALYYAVNKAVRHGRGYVWSEYWHAFKTNFKQSTLVWIVILLLGIFMGVDAYIMYQFAKLGDKFGSLYLVFVVFPMLLLAWSNYIFPYIARFENATKLVLKNTALIAIANLPWTLLLFVMLAVVCFLIWLVPPIILVLPAVYILLSNLILEKIFRKYMSEEDIAAEQERNQEFFN